MADVKEKFHKDTFDKIPADKRQRVLDAAIAEFSCSGYVGANTNTIARRARISVGSLYTYFKSKEDLYLAVIDHGATILASVIAQVDLTEGSIYDKIERMLRVAREYSRNHPELVQIYMDISTEGLSHLSEGLSRAMENVSAQFYRAQLEEARDHGDVASNIDLDIAAFCVDNIILLIQYSYTSRYFMERMKIFCGDDALTDDERVIRGIMRFIRGGLEAR